MDQYAGLAKNNPQNPITTFSLLEIPLIQNESTDSPREHLELLGVIRKMFSIPPGRLVREAGRQCLQSLDKAQFLHGVTSRLVCDFVFRSGDPFGDSSILFAGLEHS